MMPVPMCAACPAENLTRTTSAPRHWRRSQPTPPSLTCSLRTFGRYRQTPRVATGITQLHSFCFSIFSACRSEGMAHILHTSVSPILLCVCVCVCVRACRCPRLPTACAAVCVAWRCMQGQPRQRRHRTTRLALLTTQASSPARRIWWHQAHRQPTALPAR